MLANHFIENYYIVIAFSPAYRPDILIAIKLERRRGLKQRRQYNVVRQAAEDVANEVII
jgi:hypothetical protein